MIHLSGVQVRYRRTKALAGIDVQLGRGITAVVGPNGAGKTTLLRVLATALHPTEGAISVFGLNPGDPEERRAIRQQLGFLPQDTDSNASRMTVGELIDYLAIVKGHDDHRQRLEAIARVAADHQLTPRLDARIGELSAGVRRRVLLAQAFLGKPRALILDEPFTDLDPEQRQQAQRQITGTRAHAAAVVATHDIDEFVARSDTVMVLHEGRIRFFGTPAELACFPDPAPRQSERIDMQGLRRGYVGAIGG